MHVQVRIARELGCPAVPGMGTGWSWCIRGQAGLTVVHSRSPCCLALHLRDLFRHIQCCPDLYGRALLGFSALLLNSCSLLLDKATGKHSH